MPTLARTIEPMFRKVHSEGKAYINAEVNGETPGLPGVERKWMVSYFPMKAFDGNIDSLGIIVIETTEREQAEQALRKAEEQLLSHQQRENELAEAKLEKLRQQLVDKTRLATIGQMTASVAHEIRNPLGAVRNAAYFLNTSIYAQGREI